MKQKRGAFLGKNCGLRLISLGVDFSTKIRRIHKWESASHCKRHSCRLRIVYLEFAEWDSLPDLIASGASLSFMISNADWRIRAEEEDTRDTQDSAVSTCHSARAAL